MPRTRRARRSDAFDPNRSKDAKSRTAASPDLMLVNPLCCHSMVGGQRMQFGHLRRREFISLVSGTAVAWPLAARAQHPGKLPTIGFLGTTDPSTMRPWITAFVERLRDLGWIEDRTIAIAYRWAEGHPERYAEIAAEFVRLNVNVIVTTGPAAPQAKKATSVIPIVLALSGDPVGAGLVAKSSVL